MQKWSGIWFVAIFLISLSPLRVKHFGTTGMLHYAGHLIVFAVSGVIVLAEATHSTRLRRMTFVFVFCAGLEAAETLIYHNRFEWKDLFVDYFALAISPFLLYAARLLVRESSKR